MTKGSSLPQLLHTSELAGWEALTQELVQQQAASLHSSQSCGIRELQISTACHEHSRPYRWVSQCWCCIAGIVLGCKQVLLHLCTLPLAGASCHSAVCILG